MTAKVTIIDDNGNPKGTYELAPSRTYENGISTKYVFEFEYNQLNKERDYDTEYRNHHEILLNGRKVGFVE